MGKSDSIKQPHALQHEHVFFGGFSPPLSGPRPTLSLIATAPYTLLEASLMSFLLLLVRWHYNIAAFIMEWLRR